MQKYKANSFNQHTLSIILSTSKNKFDYLNFKLLYMSQLISEVIFKLKLQLCKAEITSLKQTGYGEGHPYMFI